MDFEYWKPRKIPHQVVSVCLRFLPPERRSVLAGDLMDLDYWWPGKIPHQIVSSCLEKLEPARIPELAVSLVSHSYWLTEPLPDGIIAVCWKWLGREQKAEVANRVLLAPLEQGTMPSPDSLAICFGELQPESKALVAKNVLVPGDIDPEVVKEYLHLLLPYLPDESRRIVAKEALVPGFSKHFPVHPALVAVVCRIMGDGVSEEAKVLQDWSGKWGIQQRLALAHSVGNNQATVRALNAAALDSGWLGYRQGLCFPYYEPWVEVHRAALRNWRQDRNLCFNALKHKGIFPGEVQRVCGEILAGWSEELELLSTDPSMHYGYFLRAMGHPHLRPESQEVAERMGAWLLGRNLQDTDRFYALADACRKIVEAGEFPWLVDPYCICEKRRVEMEAVGHGNPG